MTSWGRFFIPSTLKHSSFRAAEGSPKLDFFTFKECPKMRFFSSLIHPDSINQTAIIVINSEPKNTFQPLTRHSENLVVIRNILRKKAFFRGLILISNLNFLWRAPSTFSRGFAAFPFRRFEDFDFRSCRPTQAELQQRCSHTQKSSRIDKDFDDWTQICHGNEPTLNGKFWAFANFGREAQKPKSARKCFMFCSSHEISSLFIILARWQAQIKHNTKTEMPLSRGP